MNNENNEMPIFWDAAKAVHRGKWIALNAYIRRDERFQISDLHFYFKSLGEKNQTLKPKVRREEVIKGRYKWNRKQTVENIGKAANWFFKRLIKFINS